MICVSGMQMLGYDICGDHFLAICTYFLIHNTGYDLCKLHAIVGLRYVIVTFPGHMYVLLEIY